MTKDNEYLIQIKYIIINELNYINEYNINNSIILNQIELWNLYNIN